MTELQNHLGNGLAFLAGLVLFAAMLGALADLILKQNLRERMGLTALPPALFGVAAVLYGLIAFTLVIGLFLLILATIGVPITQRGDTPKELADAFLFYVLRIAGLTTVLGAVIALPFTLIRLKLTQQQTKTNEESLFNEKINAATELLYARRQHTERGEEGAPTSDVWQDDITRRNAAIDRLERLAGERPDFAPDIARMLSIYVRELTAENPAEQPPDDATPNELDDWAKDLKRKRTDMENAVQTLGHMIRDHDLADQRIDLRGANLQAFDLQETCLDKAQLNRAQLQGAELGRARLQGADLSGAQLQGAILRWARLQGANLNEARLQGADLVGARLQGAFLLGARLHGADIHGAEYHQATSLKDATLRG
ncbi:MAG: pentapeptide repeat-containing protein, partial [Pseudomonadota bacterium]